MLQLMKADHEVGFTELQKTLRMTRGNLGAHLNLLEKEGYIRIRKQFVDQKSRTTYRMTPKGHKTFKAYIDNLDDIIKEIKK